MSVQDHNHLAHTLLARFHARLLLPETPAFSEELGQLDFDYTPKAIARVDVLLQRLRRKLAPQPETFLATPGNRVFLHLLACMIGEAVARYRGTRARWLDYAGLKALCAEQGIAQTFPENFVTSLVCELEGEGLLFPLGFLCSALFNDPPGSAVAGTEQFMRRAVGVPVLSDPGPEASAAAGKDPGWRLGVALGDSARLCIEVHMATGRPFPPQLLQQQANGKGLVTDLMFAGNEGIEVARQRMEDPENGIAQALAYDGFIGLPEFRSDALVLEGICHPDASAATPLRAVLGRFLPRREAEASGEAPLRVQLALPYWPGAQDRKLALHDFRLLECSTDDAEIRERLRAGLFSRLRAAGTPGLTPGSADGLWQACYVHEEDQDHLAARHAALPPFPWEAILAEERAERRKAGVISCADFDPAAWQSALPDAENEARKMKRAAELGLTQDPLIESICNFPTLLRTGRVVWGALIQANGDLLQPGSRDLPAEVVYSIDGSVQPNALTSVAQALFALRQQLPPQADDALCRCANYLNAQTQRVFGWPVPASLAPAPGLPERLPETLRISTLWVLRAHLPHGYLTRNVLPLLLSDACPGHVMIVPSSAWPMALREMWSETK
ncbi:MAG: hypothetical protein LBO00_01165 [Zoogloeaceae bacterium]|nr:hypothetical protein [Zoogloeaceae bacterium]